MNAAMRFLWGLKTRDKTSGFRAYRAGALRSLAFRNDNFAFLPEMLIDASQTRLLDPRGADPVHGPRARRLEDAHPHDEPELPVAPALALGRLEPLRPLRALLGGLALRVLYTYPVHRYLADADSLLIGNARVLHP